MGRATLKDKIFFWEPLLNQRGQCPGPFKTKKRLQWGCTRGVLGCQTTTTVLGTTYDSSHERIYGASIPFWDEMVVQQPCTDPLYHRTDERAIDVDLVINL